MTDEYAAMRERAEEMTHSAPLPSDEGELAQDVIALLDALAENKAHIEKWAPMGDNHHNAAACPYCSPSSIIAENNAEIARLTEDLNIANERGDGWREMVKEGLLRIEQFRAEQAEQERDDYAQRLKATDESWAKTAGERDVAEARLAEAMTAPETFQAGYVKALLEAVSSLTAERNVVEQERDAARSALAAVLPWAESYDTLGVGVHTNDCVAARSLLAAAKLEVPGEERAVTIHCQRCDETTLATLDASKGWYFTTETGWLCPSDAPGDRGIGDYYDRMAAEGRDAGD